MPNMQNDVVKNSVQQELTAMLSKGCDEMNIEVTAVQKASLIEYIQLFEKWNKAYNLSAVRNVRQMIGRHLLDSLVVAPLIEGDRFIDVGTGGGLPGIPLAIMYPEREFSLLDSNGKKTRFLYQVKTQLKLDNVTIVNARVEAFHPDKLFDGVISRAFASLLDMTTGCKHLLAEGGRFWALKGIYPEDELSALEKNYKVIGSYPLRVPGEEGERHLLALTP